MLFKQVVKNNFVLLPRFLKTAPKMAEEKCTIAVCQMTVTNDKVRNLKTVERLVNTAKNLKASMVFLPEAPDFIAQSRKETLELAENLDGPTMNTYKSLASKNNIWISVGGFHELSPTLKKENKTYNTHAIIDNRGTIKTIYRKIHMFDVLIPEKNIDLRESKISKGGNSIVEPIQTPAGYLGLSICYDLRFPELSTLLRMLGATILTYPSAFTHTTGEAHWETLLRARAIENQCYVVAAAQVGIHNPKRISHGRAMIVDPWGKILAECPKYTEGYVESGTVVAAEISNKVIDKIKEQMPVFNHRRPDIYTLKVNSRNNSTGSGTSGKINYKFSDRNIPYETVFFETTYSYAFTNIRCVLPGHVLIASKKIVPRLKDLTADEVADLFQTSTRIQNLMETVHRSDSSTIVVQDGKDAGQTIPHVHVHILPRKKGDFSRNDDIYDVLVKHDTPESSVPVRQMSEMIEEAQYLKNMLEC